MDRRSLISGVFGGAAGIVVGRELAPSQAGAAADVDRSEFEALKARVAYLEGFHPPMEPPHAPKFSGSVSLPAGFVVPFGEVWDFDPNVSTTVEVAANVVVAGTLQMRPANPGVVHTLRFVGVDESAFVGGGMEPVESDVGLWVVGAGVLDIAGATKTAWTRSATAIPAGAATITVPSVDGWQVGDTVVICPTEPTTVWQYAEHYDTRTIAAITGNTVGLSAPTTHPHPTVDVGDGMVFGAEVLNLTRNARIEGAPNARAHVFVNSSVPQTIDYAELSHLGPRKPTGQVTYYGPTTAAVLGRYPLHFHMCGDNSEGSTVTGTAVHHSGGHAFVPHESNGITFDRCVAHDVFDDAYWWDGAPNPSTPSSESDRIVWSRCVASFVRYDPIHQGFRLAGFNLGSGFDNVCTDCVAVGVQGNNSASGFIWPETQSTFWTVERVVSHNHRVHGIFTWQNNQDLHGATDFVCYHNGGAGISHGAYITTYRYRNGYLHGNALCSVEVHSTSYPDPLQLRFESLHCDGTGLHANAIRFPRHNAEAKNATLFAGCRFIGHTGTTAAAVSTVSSWPERTDFVECGPVTMTYNAQSGPTSITRVQNGGAASSITPAGTTSTDPFSTFPAVQPTPFAVIASA